MWNLDEFGGTRKLAGGCSKQRRGRKKSQMLEILWLLCCFPSCFPLFFASWLQHIGGWSSIKNDGLVAAPSAPWSEERCLSDSRDPIFSSFYVMDFEVVKRYNDVQRIARLQNGPWRVPGIVVGLRVNSQLFMIKTFMWLCLSVWCALLRRCILHYLWCTLVMCDSISSVCCSCIPQWHRSARVLRIAVQQARRKNEGNVA